MIENLQNKRSTFLANKTEKKIVWYEALKDISIFFNHEYIVFKKGRLISEQMHGFRYSEQPFTKKAIRSLLKKQQIKKAY